MTRIGTNYFVSMRRAIAYYAQYGFDGEYEASRKVREGEIRIGIPHTKPGQSLGIDEDGRYYLVPQLFGVPPNHLTRVSEIAQVFIRLTAR